MDLEATQSEPQLATARKGNAYPSMTLRLLITDLIIAAILIAGAIMFALSSSDSNRLVEKQKTASQIEGLLREQSNAAFETHVSAATLREDWARAPREVRVELQADLERASADFDKTAAKLVANRMVSSLEAFESGDAALGQLSDLSQEILTFYKGGAKGAMRPNIGAELTGNYRFLFGLLNDVEETTHDNVVTTQVQIAQKAQDMSRIISTGVIMVIVSLALRFALTLRWVVLPANRLARVTTQFAEGDITQDVPRMHVRELHQISEALAVFRNMTIETDELRRRSYNAQKRAHKAHLELERRVRDSDQLLAQERQKTLAAMVTKFETSISAVVESVGSAAQELTVTADQMAREAKDAGEQANEIANASVHTTQNVEFVASAIAELSGSVSKILEQISQSGQVSKSARKISGRSAAAAKSLAQKTSDIDDMANMILKVASRTNSLALNAAKDAALDGDADGKFGAVATEVKKLADQTGQSASEIGGIMRAMNGDVQIAAKTTDDVLTSLKKIGEIGSNIRNAVNTQTHIAAEISDNAAKAAEGTKHVNANISHLAVGADRASKFAQRMKGAADKLDEQALELERAALQFAKLIRAA